MILSPLQAAQKRFLHLKQRKSNTLTAVVQVGLLHISVAGSLDSGMLDQKALVELDAFAGEGEEGWAIV